MGEELVKWVPQLTKEQRAADIAVIKATNRCVMKLAQAVKREMDGIDNWEQVSKSKASVVSRIVSVIQSTDIPSDEIVNKATQTVRQEIYAIEGWPTLKRVVISRATAAIRRLRLGGPLVLN